MEKQIKMDRISNLPWDVLDTILVHLPLRDAARTSTLSTKWRYKWTCLSQFVFDDKCFCRPVSDTEARWGEIMKIIHQVQSNHTGPIEKFKLAAFCCPNYSDLDQWINFLTEKGIKELIIKEFIFIKRFKLPSCLFSCPQLSFLELYGCMFKLPSPFKGFNCLKSIELTQVSIIGDTLESLIRSCPVLERLTLLNIDHLASLKIQSQTLKYLKVGSEFEDICLRSIPLLVIVDIHMIPQQGRVIPWQNEGGKPCNLVRVIGSLYGIKKLTLSGHFLEYLANDNVPQKLPNMLNRLTSLELMEVRFTSLKDIMATFAILRSSPNLKDFLFTAVHSIEVPRCVVEFVKSQCLYDFYFNKLKEVKIRGICGTRAEWEFISVILCHSIVLETMTIVRYGGERFPESQLQQLERASNHVRITSLTL
ncbi:F-box domain-containing protein [Cephalotus follicularis]|uniref:F-box domain-containing protein n=1 Tax=Cephalotus follicularis TaxID=3775 RepID=A0A1Q3AWF5_CEPFO|nr:F-box domain-containing protein [Cephalotus follicularis]